MVCKDCIHTDVCTLPFNTSETQVEFVQVCHHFKSKADFVEVVRCKECKYSWKNYVGKKTLFYCTFEKTHGLDEFLIKVDAEHHCSYGQRKEGAENGR